MKVFHVMERSRAVQRRPGALARRAARTVWSAGVLAYFASFGACMTSGDGAPPLVAQDGAVADAGSASDASPDIDGEVADAAPPLDAQVMLDASLDSGRFQAPDGGVCFAPPSSACVGRSGPVVQCGSLVCSGATPVCCAQRAVPPEPSCVASPSDCYWADGGVLLNSVVLVDHCDDTSDCGGDEICIDGFSKGTTPRRGGRCAAPCYPRVGGFSAYAFQRCSLDCECVESQRCSQGICAY